MFKAFHTHTHTHTHKQRFMISGVHTVAELESAL